MKIEIHEPETQKRFRCFRSIAHVLIIPVKNIAKLRLAAVFVKKKPCGTYQLSVLPQAGGKIEAPSRGLNLLGEFLRHVIINILTAFRTPLHKVGILGIAGIGKNRLGVIAVEVPEVQPFTLAKRKIHHNSTLFSFAESYVIIAPGIGKVKALTGVSIG